MLIVYMSIVQSAGLSDCTTEEPISGTTQVHVLIGQTHMINLHPNVLSLLPPPPLALYRGGLHVRCRVLLRVQGLRVRVQGLGCRV